MTIRTRALSTALAATLTAAMVLPAIPVRAEDNCPRPDVTQRDNRDCRNSRDDRDRHSDRYRDRRGPWRDSHTEEGYRRDGDRHSYGRNEDREPVRWPSDERRDPAPWESRNSSWDRQDPDANRQKTKNDWRNLAIVAGGIAVIGALKHNTTATMLGVVGALYSADRYEKDRRSQSSADRERAAYYDRSSFECDGVRYERRDVYRDGHKYWQFCRAD